MRMELRILGALEVEEDGRVVRIAGAKQRTLLALLLLHANEPVPRDRLIGELWGVKRPQTVARARTAAPGRGRRAASGGARPCGAVCRSPR
jgi:DNA-binding SARP family transcriptional activator